MTLESDATAVEAALMTAMPTSFQRLANEACRQTAEAVVREARSRLERQLKGTSVATKTRPDKGQGLTLAGIHSQPAFDGDGYVVLSDREPFPNVPLYLEKGTHVGKRHNYARTDPESFFYPSIDLEVGNHERRIEQAMQDAAGESGLGD
jgi:hypothetical protein